MKLRTIYESILNEIGDSIQVPSGATFGHGAIEFKFENTTYYIWISPFEQNGLLSLSIDFLVPETKTDMTNQNKPLKVMSYIVGSVEEWLSRYYSKKEIQLNQIKYRPKDRDNEESDNTQINGRDKLYRIFINRFAIRNNSKASFSGSGEIVAKFNPPFLIK